MKTYLLALISFVLVLTSCQEEPNEELNTLSSEELVEVVEDFPEFDWDTLKGMYIGDFAGSDIRINITYISSKNVVGYNIHKGLLRNISGKVEQSMDSVLLKMEEPGDNKFDGTFQLFVNRENLAINGIWVPFDKKLTPKTFTLKKVIPLEYEENAPITNGNFARYYSYVSDSIGEFSFDEDGFVIYSYYPNNAAKGKKDQLETVKGTWSVKGKSVIVNWQPNTAFPKSSSVFDITNDEYQRLLIGEGRELSEMYGF